MAIEIPTINDLKESAIAELEGATGQSAPTNPRSFKRVIAKVMSAFMASFYRYANDRVKQNLAQTAGLDGLIAIGAELEPQIEYKYATYAQIQIAVTTDAGKTIPKTTPWVADDTGIRYFPTANVTTISPITTFYARCEERGSDGNLGAAVGDLPSADTITLSQAISGVDSEGVVQYNTTVAIDDESIESFRRRVLQGLRNKAAYGNAYDYRVWAESVTNVERAFPYTGKPGGDEDVSAFLDGNAEDTGVTDWTAENSATLTKNTSTYHGGARSLQVARNGVADPMASQNCLTQYHYYTFSGWTYSDGNAIPVICDDDSKTNVYWRGVASSTWQYFEFDFMAETEDLMLCAETNTGTEYVLFDDMELKASFPGDRTVYVQANEIVDADGIALQSLLNEVRAAIITDPLTGLGRMGLVDTNDRLFVSSITRTSVYVELTSLEIDPTIKSATLTQIENVLSDYFLSITPFIQGVDFEEDRKDTLTKISIAAEVNTILSSVGAYATDINFDFTAGLPSPKVSYTAAFGELFKLGALTDV
jgi:hypothetical protein